MKKFSTILLLIILSDFNLIMSQDSKSEETKFTEIERQLEQEKPEAVNELIKIGSEKASKILLKYINTENKEIRA